MIAVKIIVLILVIINALALLGTGLVAIRRMMLNVPAFNFKKLTYDDPPSFVDDKRLREASSRSI